MTVQQESPTNHTTGGPIDRAADARLADEIRTHHSAMVATLDRLTAQLRDAPADDAPAAHAALRSWFDDVLVPHADEEEQTTYRIAGELVEGKLLIEAMVREHVMIKRLVGLFAATEGPVAAAYGRAVFEAFDSHQRKENEVILPLLVDSPEVSLERALGEAHGHQLDAPHGGHGHGHHDHGAHHHGEHHHDDPHHGAHHHDHEH